MPLPAVRSRRVATLRCSVIDGRRYVFRSKTRGAVAVQNQDRKSTRLNSSHSQISYAVFCLKKKKDRRTLIMVYIRRINLLCAEFPIKRFSSPLQCIFVDRYVPRLCPTLTFILDHLAVSLFD